MPEFYFQLRMSKLNFVQEVSLCGFHEVSIPLYVCHAKISLEAPR